MHDMGTFRANLDAIAERLSTRGFTLPVEQLRDLDAQRRAAITESEQQLAERNQISREVGRRRKEGLESSDLEEQSRAVGERIAALSAIAEEADKNYRELLKG